METTEKRRFGFKRWIILALIIIEIYLTGLIKPVAPAVELAAEALTPAVQIPGLGEVALTNTMVTVLIADVLLILAALAVSRAYKGNLTAPKGIAGVFEMIVEAIYNLVESVGGARWARTFFPLVGTILLMVLTVNFMKLFPLMEDIGLVHEVHEGTGYAMQEIAPGIMIIDPNAVPIEVSEAPVNVPAEQTEGAASTAHETEVETKGVEGEHAYNVIPFLRPASTDLNFTMSIALIAMITVQVIGFRAGGGAYLTKFFNFGPFLRMWLARQLGAFDILMPLINIFVGVLELIAEMARIISFTFRLFGSMFAGAILLGVTGALFKVLQLPFLFLEIFFGGVQAFVFAMLTLVFLTMATQTHGEHAEEHHEAH